jgi:hypothetical protein
MNTSEESKLHAKLSSDITPMPHILLGIPTRIQEYLSR